MAEEKLAIVTGASGALGAATAQVLAATGFTVVGVSRRPGRPAGLPETVHPETADVTDRDDVSALMDRITARFGTPDVIVNAVGGFASGEAARTTPETLGLMLDVNLHAAWWMSQAAAPHLRARGRGAIVNVASRNGVDAVAGAAAYGVSKAALVHLTRILDAELRPQGIRVNAVLPRLIDTPANRTALPADVMARAVTPAAIATVIAFLASDDATPISGAILPVYGPG